MTNNRLLIWLLRLDGVVSLAFGLSTYFFQYQVFSTAVDLASAGATGSGESLVESGLATLSGYYVLVGAIALALAAIPGPFRSPRCWQSITSSWPGKVQPKPPTAGW